MLVKKNYQVIRGIAIDFMSSVNPDHSFYREHLFPLMAVFSRRPLLYMQTVYTKLSSKSINPPVTRLNKSRVSVNALRRRLTFTFKFLFFIFN